MTRYSLAHAFCFHIHGSTTSSEVFDCVVQFRMLACCMKDFNGSSYRHTASCCSFLIWYRYLRSLALKVRLAIKLWGDVSMCGYFPHINGLFVVFTHCTRRCSRNTTVSQLHAADATVPLSAGFPWRWKSPAVGWSRLVAPLTAASNILLERKAWALREKPPCGGSPTKPLIRRATAWSAYLPLEFLP
jgi:hypothetical protein